MPDLEALLVDLTSGDDVRAEAAVSSLAELGEAALPSLLQLLEFSSRDHRWWAVRALTALEEPAGWLGAVRGLEDPDPSVRQCAALALRHRPLVEAVPALSQALADPDRLTARLAANALGAVGPAATPALVRALVSALPAVRIEAARALADLRDRVHPRSLRRPRRPLDGGSVLGRRGPGAHGRGHGVLQALAGPCDVPLSCTIKME